MLISDVEELVRLWSSFFSDEEENTLDSNSGETEKEEKEENEEIDYSENILSILSNLRNLRFSASLFKQFLATRTTLPEKALTTYYLHEQLTDESLAEHLQLRSTKQASDLRGKPSIKADIEAKTDGRPREYGLNAPAALREEERIREWLENLNDAEEARKRAATRAKEEAVLSGQIGTTGTLRAEVAEQFREGNYAVEVNFREVALFSPDLAETLLDQPEKAIKSAEVALRSSYDGVLKTEPQVLVSNLPDSERLTVAAIRSEHLGSLIVLRGEPEIVSEVGPQVEKADFECPSCGYIITVMQLEQKFREPSLCGQCGRKGRFRLSQETMVDTAAVSVAPLLSETLSGVGTRHRLGVFVKGALTHPERYALISPGNPIEVCGIVKDRPVELKRGGVSVRKKFLLHATSYRRLGDDGFNLVFTPEEEAAFRKAVSEPEFFRKFAESVFPTHHGDDHVKKGIVLQLLAGQFTARNDLESLNIYLPGDPGTGKTRNFLRRAAKIAPKSRFAFATSSSGAGLLGSANTTDSETGRKVYEPGALPRADRGLLVLDELPALLPEEMKALNEALEEGTVTIDKANLHLSVRADIRVLAAGNPVNGRFDDYTELNQDILGVEASTLDRFGLIFPIRDKPDEEKDRSVVARMNTPVTDAQEWSDDWLRRFITYARASVIPRMRPEEEQRLEQFYVVLRQSSAGAKLTVSARQYATLRALTLLSAKAHLRTMTNESDIALAVGILEPMLKAFDFDIGALWKHQWR